MHEGGVAKELFSVTLCIKFRPLPFWSLFLWYKQRASTSLQLSKSETLLESRSISGHIRSPKKRQP